MTEKQFLKEMFHSIKSSPGDWEASGLFLRHKKTGIKFKIFHGGFEGAYRSVYNKDTVQIVNAKAQDLCSASEHWLDWINTQLREKEAAARESFLNSFKGF